MQKKSKKQKLARLKINLSNPMKKKTKKTFKTIHKYSKFCSTVCYTTVTLHRQSLLSEKFVMQSSVTYINEFKKKRRMEFYVFNF